MGILLSLVTFAAGLALLLYATLGRKLGIHRPLRSQGGGNADLVVEVAGAIFLLGLGLMAISSTTGLVPLPLGALALIVALGAWLVGFIFQQRGRRQHAAEEHALRAKNAMAYPGIFDCIPPGDLDAIKDDPLDLYDSGQCIYLGPVSRRDMRFLVEQFKDLADTPSNDVFVLSESIESLPETAISPECRLLLTNALEERGYLILRWMPPQHSPPPHDPDACTVH
jgi:hypothetical protein